jgi:hypothetical protein
MSVQSSLVMHPINTFGSEEQKEKVGRVSTRLLMLSYSNADIMALCSTSLVSRLAR